MSFRLKKHNPLLKHPDNGLPAPILLLAQKLPNFPTINLIPILKHNNLNFFRIDQKIQYKKIQ